MGYLQRPYTHSKPIIGIPFSSLSMNVLTNISLSTARIPLPLHLPMAQDPTGMPTRQPRLGVPEVRTVDGAGRRLSRVNFHVFPFTIFYENNAMPGRWLMSPFEVSNT